MRIRPSAGRTWAHVSSRGAVRYGRKGFVTTGLVSGGRAVARTCACGSCAPVQGVGAACGPRNEENEVEFIRVDAVQNIQSVVSGRKYNTSVPPWQIPGRFCGPMRCGGAAAPCGDVSGGVDGRGGGAVLGVSGHEMGHILQRK